MYTHSFAYQKVWVKFLLCSLSLSRNKSSDKLIIFSNSHDSILNLVLNDWASILMSFECQELSQG